MEGRTRYKNVYDDIFQEEVGWMELSSRQELYYKERENDVVGQQKEEGKINTGQRVCWYTGCIFTFLRCLLWYCETLLSWYLTG